jgi:hypothetical protein
MQNIVFTYLEDCRGHPVLWSPGVDPQERPAGGSWTDPTCIIPSEGYSSGGLLSKQAIPQGMGGPFPDHTGL